MFLFTGCQAPQYNCEDQPSPEPATLDPQDVREPPPSPSDFGKTSVKGPATRVSAPWMAVSDWTRTHALQLPQRVSTTTNPVFEVESERGVFTFQIGTTQARFNGAIVFLGFEPTVFAGEPCLHELDMAKNLEPLLLEDAADLAEWQRIVLDPGHGGGNTGTRSANGELEKDYTLDWALRLEPLLATNGWTVLLTRTDDSELALAERVEFAEAVGADLFISLHFNASGGGTHQAGLETYCLTPAGMPSNLTRGYEETPDIAFPNNAFDTQNLQLAVRLHQALLEINGGEDRGIRKARFMGVLRGQNRPAVLLEGGFLSNPGEAARVDDPAYRQELAEAIASALCALARHDD
jgi:N-acetylmuramoyl-L-alanine amidase